MLSYIDYQKIGKQNVKVSYLDNTTTFNIEIIETKKEDTNNDNKIENNNDKNEIKDTIKEEKHPPKNDKVENEKETNNKADENPTIINPENPSLNEEDITYKEEVQNIIGNTTEEDDSAIGKIIISAILSIIIFMGLLKVN